MLLILIEVLVLQKLASSRVKSFKLLPKLHIKDSFSFRNLSILELSHDIFVLKKPRVAQSDWRPKILLKLTQLHNIFYH